MARSSHQIVDGRAHVVVDNNVLLAASAEDVWNVVGEFLKLEDWIRTISVSREEPGSHDQKLRRVLMVENDVELVERELERHDRWYTYALVEHPFPISDYHGEMAVYLLLQEEPESLFRWKVQFQCDPAAVDELVKLAHQLIYDPGLAALVERFGLPERRP